MTITTDECITAIKNSTINPVFNYINDWLQIRRFQSKSGDWIREFKSESMDETIYVFEHESEIIVSYIKPDIEWAYEIQPYANWDNEHEIKFKVFDIDGMITGPLTNAIKQIPYGSEEIEDGMFINKFYTEYNFRKSMMYLGITDKTPELAPRPEKECKSESCEEEGDE